MATDKVKHNLTAIMSADVKNRHCQMDPDGDFLPKESFYSNPAFSTLRFLK